MSTTKRTCSVAQFERWAFKHHPDWVEQVEGNLERLYELFAEFEAATQ